MEDLSAPPGRSRVSLMRGVSLLGVALALAAPGYARAQTAQDNGFEFELRARAQYDSNVARASGTAADMAGVEPADIRYTVSAAVDGGRRIGSYQTFLRGSLSYDFYDKNKSLERWRGDLNGGASGRLGPCAAAVNAGYLRTLSELSPIRPTDPRNSVESVVSYGASTSCPIFGSIGGTVAVQRREISPSGSLVQVGSDTTTVTTSVGYVSRVFGQLSLFGSYGKTNYDQAATATLSAASGFENYSVGMQYTRPIGTRMSGSASISYFELKRDSASNPLLAGGDTNGLAWNLGVTYRASNRLSMDLNYTDSTGATARANSSYQHEKRAAASVRYQASRRLRASVRVDYSDRNFSGGANSALGLASSEQRFNYGGSITYDLGRNTSLSFDANRSKVETDQALLDYTAERAGVSVTTKF